MIYLLMSIITSVVVVSFFKLFETYKVNTFEAIVINYLTCAVLGNLVADTPGILTPFWREEWFTYTLILGVLFISVFYSIAQTAQKIGVSVSMVAAKLSVALPVVFALFAHNESLSPLKLFGILVSLSAVYFISRSSENTTTHKNLWYLPLFVFLGSGLIDTLLSFINKRFIPPFDTNHILSFVFATAFCLGSMVLLVGALKKQTTPSLKSVLWGIGLGIPNYMCMYFLLKTLASFKEASLVLPINNIGIVLVSTLTGVFLFKEQLSRINKVGLGLAILSIVVLALS